MKPPPIFFVTGPPAVGKTVLCEALVRRFPFDVHIPVDDLRTWVMSGLSESVPWTEETERQFQVAERAACGIARAYHEAGFAVAVDHCRNLQRLDAVIAEHLSDLPVVKVCLTCDLETNLRRNRERANKDFQHDFLVETIEYLNPRMAADPPEGWVVINNQTTSVEGTVKAALESSARRP